MIRGCHIYRDIWSNVEASDTSRKPLETVCTCDWQKIFVGSNFRTLCTCSKCAKFAPFENFPAIRYARLHVCVCVCVCRIYWTYSQHKQYYCRVDDEVAWASIASDKLHPKKTALPVRLQNIAANHCHAVTWGSSCDQISITLSCAVGMCVPPAAPMIR